MYCIKMYPDMGRGLEALHTINKGIIIAEFEIIPLSKFDTYVINTRTQLGQYTFELNSKQDCLVLGDGGLFNHADTPNVGYAVVEVSGRLKMRFWALGDINTGDQLMIDYKADCRVLNLENYFKKAK